MIDATETTRYATTPLVIAIVTFLGCADRSLPTKDYDSQAIAAAVLASYDADDDGKLDEDELLKCLPLQSALDRIDANEDGAVDASEIAGRINAYAAMSQYIVAEVFVRQGGRPAANALVTLTLTEFMQSNSTKFTATTSAAGNGMPQSSPEGLLGFPPGFYDVEVVHGGRTWSFGVEMADDNPTVNRLGFDLTEK